MTTKKTSAGAPAEATETPTSVTAALAALETSSATFLKDQQALLKVARDEATKAGEEFAKLAQRPDPEVLEKLELDLSTARLQLTEVGKEIDAAAGEVRAAHATAEGLRGELAAANTTIAELREAARADAELISTMRSRTEAIAAQFEAARNVLSLPDLELPERAPAQPVAPPVAETDAQPAVVAIADAEPAPAEPAVDLFGLGDAPVIEAQPAPGPFPEPEPAAAEAKEDDGPFNATPSFGTFRPVLDLPDVDFDAPAPAKPVDPDFEDVAAEAPVTELELPALEAPAEAAAPEMELPDLEAPAEPQEAAELPGLDLPDVEPGDKPFDPFDLLTLPDLEAETVKEPAFAGQAAS